MLLQPEDHASIDLIGVLYLIAILQGFYVILIIYSFLAINLMQQGHSKSAAASQALVAPSALRGRIIRAIKLYLEFYCNLFKNYLLMPIHCICLVSLKKCLQNRVGS